VNEINSRRLRDRKRQRLVAALDGFTRLLTNIQDKFLASVADLGLTTRQLVYLEKVAEMEDPRLSDLARALGLSKPSITAMVETFERMGYLRKARAADDARSFRVQLTDRARKLRELHDRTHEEIAQVFIRRLNDTELERLTELLERTMEG
jgi:DNA-binding MarR family transcriptional regulator